VVSFVDISSFDFVRHSRNGRGAPCLTRALRVGGRSGAGQWHASVTDKPKGRSQRFGGGAGRSLAGNESVGSRASKRSQHGGSRDNSRMQQTYRSAAPRRRIAGMAECGSALKRSARFPLHASLGSGGPAELSTRRLAASSAAGPRQEAASCQDEQVVPSKAPPSEECRAKR
jgi:hypothetical protein